MNKLLNALTISSRGFAVLMLTGAAVACIGCQSTRSSVNGPGGTNSSVRESEPFVPARSQTSSQYHIEASMWPLATNSARVYPDRYDLAVLDAITQRWYSFLDHLPTVTRKGKVVLEFKLRSDGSVVESRIVKSTVSTLLETICQKAVLDPAPFPPWPETMRRAFTDGYRVMTFTFYLNGNA